MKTRRTLQWFVSPRWFHAADMKELRAAFPRAAIIRLAIIKGGLVAGLLAHTEIVLDQS